MNEAAERLRTNIGAYPRLPFERLYADLDAALATERRATCYRLLKALDEHEYIAQKWVYDLIEQEAAR